MNHYARNRYTRDQEAMQLNTVKQYTTAVLVVKLTRQLQHLILCIELTNLSIPIKILLKIKFGLNTTSTPYPESLIKNILNTLDKKI